MNRKGLTLLEMLVATFVVGLVATMAMPSLNNLRMAMALESAEESVAEVITRARWMAISSGRTRTVELTSPTVVSITDGTNVLASIDVAGYGVTVSTSNLPFSFDGRGFLPAAADPPGLTLASPRLPATRSLTVGPLGKLDRS